MGAEGKILVMLVQLPTCALTAAAAADVVEGPFVLMEDVNKMC